MSTMDGRPMDSDDLLSARTDEDYVYDGYEEQYSDEEVEFEDEFEEEEEEDWADEFDDYEDEEVDGGRRRRRQEWE